MATLHKFTNISNVIYDIQNVVYNELENRYDALRNNGYVLHYMGSLLVGK